MKRSINDEIYDHLNLYCFFQGKIMKTLGIFFISLFLLSCGDGQIEEFAFKKTLEMSLVDLCGEEDKECIVAVKSQISDCMEKSNWRKYMEEEESDAEFNRFTREFYSCVVDANGDPYFEPNI